MTLHGWGDLDSLRSLRRQTTKCDGLPHQGDLCCVSLRSCDVAQTSRVGLAGLAPPRSLPGEGFSISCCIRLHLLRWTAVAPYISAGRSMPVVGAHAAIWILVFLAGGSLAGGLPRRSGAVGESRCSSNFSVASGWPPGGCRRWREGRQATENGGDGNISPACDRRFRPANFAL